MRTTSLPLVYPRMVGMISVGQHATIQVGWHAAWVDCWEFLNDQGKNELEMRGVPEGPTAASLLSYSPASYLLIVFQGR